MRIFKTYERHGFFISRTGGHDTPWIGRRADGLKFRADTLQGAFAMARDWKDKP